MQTLYFCLLNALQRRGDFLGTVSMRANVRAEPLGLGMTRHVLTGSPGTGACSGHGRRGRWRARPPLREPAFLPRVPLSTGLPVTVLARRLCWRQGPSSSTCLEPVPSVSESEVTGVEFRVGGASLSTLLSVGETFLSCSFFQNFFFLSILFCLLVLHYSSCFRTFLDLWFGA